MSKGLSGQGWVKMVTAGVVMCIGGPALVYYVSPTEEELFKKYNPDLQKRSLEGRDRKQQEFDDFVGRLKEYSKSNKPIWQVQAEEEARMKNERRAESVRVAEEVKKQQEEMKKQALSGK